MPGKMIEFGKDQTKLKGGTAPFGTEAVKVTGVPAVAVVGPETTMGGATDCTAKTCESLAEKLESPR